MMIRNNMKWGLLVAIFTFSACNNTEEIENGGTNSKSKVTIEITESNYEDISTHTRANVNEANLENLPELTQISDCSVATDVESDTAKDERAATRAITTPTHYKVRVYQGSTKVGELSGVLAGNSFTPDAGTSNQLDLKRNTTYTFVCFNDDVDSNGDNLEVVLAKAATARIGRSTFTTSGDGSTAMIKIVAKHAGARVRTKIMAYKHIVKPFKATFSSNTPDIPTKVSFNPLTNSYTTLSSAAFVSEENNSPLSNETKFSGSGYGGFPGFTSCGPWHYVLPGTNVNHFQMDITEGQVYWKNIAGNIPKLTISDYIVAANGTYSARVPMKPVYTYLFSDGTTGSLAANPNKHAVAVVVDADQRLAAAIEEAGNGAKYVWQAAKYGYNHTAAKIVADNWMPYLDYTFTNGESGYDNTWDASTSSSIVEGNKVRGENPDFPAFYAAAHFTPSVGVTGSLVGKKWFLPSELDYFYAVVTLGFTEKAELKGLYKAYSIYGLLFERAFKEAGGKPFLNDEDTKHFWTSTAFNGGGQVEFQGIATIFGSQYPDYEYKVRAFIKY